jgi:membrane-bound lytic murein transglycosylase D
LSATQRKKSLQNQPRKGVKVVHIVQRGDTFWDLAQLHKVNVRSLAKWNGMAPRDPLTPGQKLVIWSRSSIDTSTLQAAVLSLPQQRTVTKRIGYRVRRGDSLAKISRKFRVSVSQLRRWNDLPEGKYLQPGQRLTVYVDVTRQSS